jgi:hypothetical protein
LIERAVLDCDKSIQNGVSTLRQLSEEGRSEVRSDSFRRLEEERNRNLVLLQEMKKMRKL